MTRLAAHMKLLHSSLKYLLQIWPGGRYTAMMVYAIRRQTLAGMCWPITHDKAVLAEDGGSQLKVFWHALILFLLRRSWDFKSIATWNQTCGSVKLNGLNTQRNATCGSSRQSYSIAEPGFPQTPQSLSRLAGLSMLDWSWFSS